jgi:hypothetical protein
VLVLRRLVLPRLLALPPPALRATSAAHNAVLLTLSAAMAAGCALSMVATAPAPRWAWPFCFLPRGATEASGPVFFWAHVFYLSKVYELGDTLLILLARPPRFQISLRPGAVTEEEERLVRALDAEAVEGSERHVGPERGATLLDAVVVEGHDAADERDDGGLEVEGDLHVEVTDAGDREAEKEGRRME